MSATTAPTQFLESRDRRLAYRTFGSGKPIVLCTRFRGTMDLWDPLFLDSLAARGFQVFIFDYSGLGLSTGTRSYNPQDLARDARDLIEGLRLTGVVLAGWSLGGLAAQVGLVAFPQQLSHLVLLGTGPAGLLVKPAEQLFHDLARKPENSFDDELALFFEPSAPESVEAARASAARIQAHVAARGEDRSPPVPIEFAAAVLGDRPKNPIFPADAVLAAMTRTTLPILHVGGDHDISFPIENWYALNGKLPTLQLLTFPHTGHAPQHQHPVAVAAHIAAFAEAGV
jgi:pimeloyl-ACP methyl ester carboxylesterase